jgi:F-type H+-transporting ATPase subunit b
MTTLGDFTILGLPISPGTMIYQAFIFTVLTLLLKKFALKKLVNVIDTRKNHIENQLKTAEMYKHEAEKNLEASNFTLKKARKEAREILSHSETEAERIIKDAKVEAKKILKEAKEDALFVRSQSFDPKGHNKGA